jgi:septal ring factor EnvC (AmiA/AmiB activator)
MNKLKQQREINLKNLQNIELAYKKELQKIIASQNRLQKQLAQLNIIKTKELQKQRQKQKALQRQKELSQRVDKTKIKNYGNIYMKTKTARYKGAKTIAPLKGKIVKKFGAYKDPIYHILLYNDSITITPLEKNAKVRAIMNGKVVFVGDTSEGKIIVIKHRNKLHSIYAKLSRISPFVKKGYKVKKGEVIAKVDKELEFEITYKTLPINPMEVIKF